MISRKKLAISHNMCYTVVEAYSNHPRKEKPNMKKRLLIALCCLVLLVQLLPIVPMAETVDVGTVPQELYYCREALKTLENSEALLFAYDNIVAGIDACAEEIIISNSQYQISPAEFEMVLEATRRDHTEQFWMGGSYTPKDDGYVFWSLKPT
jgi:hypothetical protein